MVKTHTNVYTVFLKLQPNGITTTAKLQRMDDEVGEENEGLGVGTEKCKGPERGTILSAKTTVSST